MKPYRKADPILYQYMVDQFGFVFTFGRWCAEKGFERDTIVGEQNRQAFEQMFRDEVGLMSELTGVASTLHQLNGVPGNQHQTRARHKSQGYLEGIPE